MTRYVGELDRLLTDIIDSLISKSIPDNLAGLNSLFEENGRATRIDWDAAQLAKTRAAVMIAIGAFRDDMVSLVGQSSVSDIEGRWTTILNTLAETDVHVLKGGPLERYLPSFSGNLFTPSGDAKRTAVESELGELQQIREATELSLEQTLENRYTFLYEIVKKLPSKSEVGLREDTTKVH